MSSKPDSATARSLCRERCVRMVSEPCVLRAEIQAPRFVDCHCRLFGIVRGCICSLIGLEMLMWPGLTVAPHDTTRLCSALMFVRQCKTCVFETNEARELCGRHRDRRALGLTMSGSSSQTFGLVRVEYGAMQVTAAVRNPRVSQLSRDARLLHAQSDKRK